MKKFALISVSDKTGIITFAKALVDLGYTIISTGGTAKTLAQKNIPHTPIQEVTGNPESFDGRMKTISFQIESGILFDRTNPNHVEEAKKLKIKPIDIVVCNLYPFEETIKKQNVTMDEAIENIDVGGPTMVRSAAKNYKNVLVVVEPNDYNLVIKTLKNKSTEETFRRELAAKAFGHLSFYDAQIAQYLQLETFPNEIVLPGRKLLNLRYGENPHQQGAVYTRPSVTTPFNELTKHWGRDLSLINITDINAGLTSVRLFGEPAAAVIKHNSPSGLALGETIDEALTQAIVADPESAFGGIIVLNKPLDLATAKIVGGFKDERRGNIDIIAAPIIKKNALAFLQKVRKTMGIYTFGEIPREEDPWNLKWIDGGFVLQTADVGIADSFGKWEIVTKKKPTKKQLLQMQIGWKFVSRIRSNTILIMDKNLPMTRGIGSGQTSRIRSTKIALEQAGTKTKSGILVSDSFFPFPDSVELAAKHGITAIVQQGGSINDTLSIEAADKAGIAMVFTHRRAFWH
ncbi:MAG: bifunctional phosphoribosylaminoimidazolecarboxamide formyltransferase/IMP cyclohydrolase [Patescibacteria group bacterium]